MGVVTGVLFRKCQSALAATDVGSNREGSAGRSFLGFFLLLLLLAGIGTLAFISLQDLLRGALIETPGLCIWV